MKKLTAVIGAILMALVLFSCAEPETPKYTVSFEGMEHDPVTVTVGEKFKLPEDLPSKDGYALIVKMGDVVLEKGKEYEITADTVLECSWKQTIYTVTFKGIEYGPVTVEDGRKFTLPPDLPKPETGKKLVVKMGDEALVAGQEYEITADTELICSYETLRFTLSINGVRQIVDYGYVYEFKEEEERPGHRFEFKCNGGITDQRKFTITGTTNISYRWIEQVTIKVDGKDTVVDKGKYIIPPKNGYYTEKVTSGSNIWHVGDEIEVSDGMTLVYESTPGTEGFSVYDYGEVWRYEGSETKIVIPDATADGLKITQIGGSLFSGNQSITSVILPDSVEVIKDSAFYECRNLTSIRLPRNLTQIWDKAFWFCSKLETMELPGTLAVIGENAFLGAGLKSVVIPEGVTSIAEGAFSSCPRLSSVTLPSTLAVIDDNVFLDTALTSIEIPEGVTRIGSGAFGSCDVLEKVTIPKTVTEIGPGNPFWDQTKQIAFTMDPANKSYKLVDNCIVTSDGKTVVTGSLDGKIPKGVVTIAKRAYSSTLHGNVTLPATVEVLEDYAFKNSRTTITLNEGLKVIGQQAFESCTLSLEEGCLVIPSTVEEIKDYAFSGAGAFSSARIPASVKKIGMSAIYAYGTGVKTITVDKPRSECAGFASGWTGADDSHKVTVTYSDGEQVVYPEATV